jgi:hypothetical protein
MIKLGATYTDKITGFTGVATGKVEYLTGCNQVLVQPKVGADGNLSDSRWFDEQRLELCKSVAVIVLENGATPGFDSPAPRK